MALEHREPGVRVGIISDIHLGPDTWHEGELRKVGREAGALTRSFVRAMNERFRPHFVLVLGDLIEDHSPAEDWKRYCRVFETLAELHAPLYPVAGNHDLVHLSPEQVLSLWSDRAAPGRHTDAGQTSTLYYAARQEGLDLVVLHSRELEDHRVWMDEEQIAWLGRTLDAVEGPVLLLLHHSLADQDTTGNPWFDGRSELALVRQRSRVRALLAASGKVLAVLNGHLHWNDLSLHDGIPFITLQSLIENADRSEPGRACRGWAEALLLPGLLRWRVQGHDPLSLELALPGQRGPKASSMP